MARYCDYWEQYVFSRDLLHKRNDGYMTWRTVGKALIKPDKYPIDRKIAQRLVDAFYTLKETDGKQSITVSALFPMIDLSQTEVGKEFDIVNTQFIEFFCDVYFTRTYGMPELQFFNADEVHTFLVSEPRILEEIRGLPGYPEYVDYVLKMTSVPNEFKEIRESYRTVYDDLNSVSQSGRLTKRAVAGDCPDS